MPVRVVHLTKAPERIAIIKPSALGDIAHALPVLSALRTRFPAAHISWIVNRGYAPILEGHRDLDEIIPFDRGALRKSWLTGSWEFTRFLKRLHSNRFDLVIDLQGLFRTGLMSLATGARTRIGLASAREGARFCYSHRVEDRLDVTHAVDRYWRVIEAMGEAPTVKAFHVPIQAEARRWAREILQKYPRPWLAVGAGSRWLTKRWPPEHFAALVQRAQTQFGGSAIFVGTPEEASLAQQATALVTGPSCQLTGATTLPQLVAILDAADVMIANDTGPLHLAVALGRPVIAPYTCTRVEKTGPYGQNDRAVETSVWCKGSYLKTCPRMECMAELTPTRLWPALDNILRTWQQHHHAA
ncbi:MAG: glycosyltransferase family 9 protein [Gemmataceae bacterium]|nr:glycosyltransferase family 9 protein [Gemmataceae bacterium]